MTVAWLTKELASRLPVPAVWWNTHHRLGARSAAEKQYALSRSLTQLCWASYVESVGAYMEVDGVDIEGRQVVVYGIMFDSMSRGQEPGLGRGLTLVTDPDLLNWVTSNEGGIVELVLWHLAYEYSRQMFSTSRMAHWRNRPNEDRPSPLQTVRQPDKLALGWANACVLAHLGEYPMGQLFAAEWANLIAAEVDWPLPPYPFGVNGALVD